MAPHLGVRGTTRITRDRKAGAFQRARKMGMVFQVRWMVFVRENPNLEMDDLGVPP